MIDLRKLFIDGFYDLEHSNAELLRYTTQHLAITSAPANNPGNVFNAILAATNTALTNFATCVGDKTFNKGVRESANLQKTNFRKSLKGPIGQAAAAVEVAFGKGTPDYVACFPEGRTGITEATEDLLKGKLQALNAALTARSASTGIPAQITVVTGLITTWTALLSAADVADGTESGSDEARKVCRKVLTVQLWKNALTIGLQFVDHPEKAALYLPQQLLRNPLHPGGPGAATLSAGTWNSTSHLVTLTMGAEDATVFTLQRRLVGAPAFETVVDDIGADADGNATFDDEIAAGNYEYRVVPRDGDGVEGEPSNVVTVNAA